MSLRRLLQPVVVTAVTLGLLAPTAIATAGPTQLLPKPGSSGSALLTASAFGTFGSVGDVVASGKTAPVSLGSCGTFVAPRLNTRAVAGVDARPLVASGTIGTSARSLRDQTRQGARSTSRVEQVNVLEGLITAASVRAVAAGTFDGTHAVSAAGSELVDAEVAGVPIEGAPEPNTEIELPGIGRVVLNEQTVRQTANGSSLVVNMIHVFVTLPNPITPVGTEIVVGNATAGTNSSVAGTAASRAYGSFLKAEGRVVSGQTALASVGCLGSGGQVVVNGIAGIEIPGLVQTGTVTDTAVGEVTDTTSSSEASSVIEGVNVADGAVTATTVTAHASAQSNGRNGAYTDEGSSFVNLVVNGEAIGDDVEPNTMIEIPGLGTVWLRRIIRTPTAIEVRMIELVLEAGNTVGLAPLTELRVAVARATADHRTQGGLLSI